MRAQFERRTNNLVPRSAACDGEHEAYRQRCGTRTLVTIELARDRWYIPVVHSGRPIRVVVAEPHPSLHDGISSLLQTAPGMLVLGQATSGENALQLTDELQPDILLLTIEMPNVPVAEFLREVGKRAPRTRAIVVADDASSPRGRQVLEHGARGVLDRHSPKEILFKCVRGVAVGEYWVGREQVANLVQYLRDSKAKSAAASQRT